MTLGWVDWVVMLVSFGEMLRGEAQRDLRPEEAAARLREAAR